MNINLKIEIVKIFSFEFCLSSNEKIREEKDDKKSDNAPVIAKSK